MNLKFMRRVSEREWAIRQFVVGKNKLTSVNLVLNRTHESRTHASYMLCSNTRKST